MSDLDDLLKSLRGNAPVGAVRNLVGNLPVPVRRQWAMGVPLLDVPAEGGVVEGVLSLSFVSATVESVPPVAFVARRLCVFPAEVVVVGLHYRAASSPYEEDCGGERDFAGGRDEEGRFVAGGPTPREGTYDLGEHNALPLLREGDQLRVRVRGAPAGVKVSVLLLGEAFFAGSMVPAEVSFDVELVEPGEGLLHLRRDVPRLTRFDRLWIPRGLAPRFEVAGVSVDDEAQLVSPVPAEFLVTAPRLLLFSSRRSASISVRCVVAEPSRFTARLIGMSIEP